MTPPIEDYAIIGDCETGALVSRTGSIDWLCWPRFDSAACFAALLGTAENGRWLLAPADAAARSTRRYRGETLILETDYETADGAVQIVDFMPLRRSNADLVRTVTGKRGRVVIRTDVELRGENLTTVGDFTIGEGESVSFVLTWGPSHLPPPAAVEPGPALVDTEQFWRQWSARCTYKGPWRDAVMRSLLTLKALIYHPTGGIVAPLTTSLPESLGGVRHWDYRHCLLRAATLTLLALMDAGYYDEAQAWRDWLLRAAAGSASQVQIMYGISGERHLREWDVPWLPGYEGSKPVRIGNAAHEQLQLDVYGEIMDALHQARAGGMKETVETWHLQRALIDHLATIWREQDHGLWEVRGPPQHFTHSKVMAWVAVDRAVKSAEQFHLEGPLDTWRALRQTMHDEISREAFNARLACFLMPYGASIVDASLLLMPQLGFLPADDPRF